MLHALETALEDDKLLIEEEKKAIAEAERTIDQGKIRLWEQVKREM